MIRKLSLASIRLYQMALSPYLPAVCRHVPNCSNYAYEAIDRHGLGTGTWLAAKRLGRCRPLGTKGYDPVP